jgi:iron(III) transport system permease protein
MHDQNRIAKSWMISAAIVATIVVVFVWVSDGRNRVLSTHTLLLASSVAAASTVLGAPLALLLARTAVRGRRLCALLLMALLFLPLYVQAAAWQAAGGLQGWYTLATGWPAPLAGWRGAIAIHTMAAIPWVVLIVGVGLQLSEAELEEAALLDGTTAQVFARVTLPRAAHAIFAALLWVAIATAGEITVTDLFQVRTYAEQLYTEFALGDRLDADPWALPGGAIAIVGLVAAALWLVGRLMPAEHFAVQRRNPTLQLGAWRAPAALLMWGTVGLLAGIPLVSLATKAGMVVTRDGGALTRHWSAARFGQIVGESPWRFSHELGWSLTIGAAAAAAAVVLALPLAWCARRGGWGAAPAWAVIALGLALPGPLVGLAIIACFNAADWTWLVWLYDRSIAAIWLAQTVRSLPLCTLVLWYALRTIPAELMDSATLDGASAWARLTRVAMPQRKMAIAVAWWVALAVAWGDLSASILVVPPGVMTLPIRVFGLIHYGVDDQVAGISLSVMALFFVLALILGRIARRADDSI